MAGWMVLVACWKTAGCLSLVGGLLDNDWFSGASGLLEYDLLDRDCVLVDYDWLDGAGAAANVVL